jgi:membrane protein
MRRVSNGFLWTLGIGAAVAALVRPDRTAEQPEPEPTGPESPSDPSLAEAAGEAAGPAATQPMRLTNRLFEQAQPQHNYLRRLGAEIREDNVTLIAGSMSYYGMLALFPAMIAAVSIYGLAFDPDDLAEQLERIAEVLPAVAANIITEQLIEITDASTTGLRFGVIVAILISLYTASAGMRALIKGLNVAYDVTEDRSFTTVRALAYGITLGAIVAIVAAMAIIVFLPAWLESVGFGEGGALAELIVLPFAFVVAVAGLNVLYRVAPSRHPRYSRWASAGSLVAAAGWILATAGLSIYINRSGNLNATYGTLTGVIVLLLWFFLSGFAVLLGAEVNALTEKRRAASAE